ncbi:MAG TPA: helix-turn-helix domain-containing protein [Burkholderiales bacterium]
MDLPDSPISAAVAPREGARDLLEARVLTALRVLYSASHRHYRTIERRSGVPAAALRALSEVNRQPGITSAALAGALGVRPATASNVLRVLEAEGLVERVRERRDRRVVRLHATARGARQAAASGGAAGGVLATTVAALGEKDLDRLDLGLQAMLRAIPESGREVSPTSLAFGPDAPSAAPARRRQRRTR